MTRQLFKIKNKREVISDETDYFPFILTEHGFLILIEYSKNLPILYR